MKITLIASISDNFALGVRGGLPWHLPDDFKHFKNRTMGAPVIMGRITHESIGRTLPGRRNFVITSHPEKVFPGSEVSPSLPSILLQLQSLGLPEVFIIGGAKVYEQALPHATHMSLTRVHTVIRDADVFFPQYSLEEWECISQIHHSKDDRHQFDFDILEFERRPY